MYSPKDVIRSYQMIYDNKLYEKFHIFNGLQNDVKIVFNLIKSFLNDIESKKNPNIINVYNKEFNNIKLSFCNLTLIVEIEKFVGDDYTSLNAEYFKNEGIIKNNIFKAKIGIYPIYASLTQKFLNEIEKTIAHELTHAYNDYMAKLNGKSLKYNINTILLNKILNYSNKNSIEYYVASLTYALNKLEQQAVISELYFDTKYNAIEMQDNSNPIDIFKKTNTIRLLAKLYSLYKCLLQINPEYYKRVEEIFKQVSNKVMSYNKIMKYFYKEILSFTNMCTHFSSTVSYDVLKRLHECTDDLKIKYAINKNHLKEKSKKIINKHHILYNICLN